MSFDSEMREIYGDDWPEYRENTAKRRQRFGATNDLPFIVTLGNRKHPVYSMWDHMLERSLSNTWKQKYPTYKDTHCCESWLIASNFAKFTKGISLHGLELDKDILVENNKIYSPDTCLLVPQNINKFIINTNKTGTYMLGVTYESDRNKFRARINNPFTGRREYLGRFDTELLAHIAWCKKKAEFTEQYVQQGHHYLNRILSKLQSSISKSMEVTNL